MGKLVYYEWWEWMYPHCEWDEWYNEFVLNPRYVDFWEKGFAHKRPCKDKTIQFYKYHQVRFVVD